MKKKILLSIGIAGSLASPLVTAISCGDGTVKSIDKNSINFQVYSKFIEDLDLGNHLSTPDTTITVGTVDNITEDGDILTFEMSPKPVTRAAVSGSTAKTVIKFDKKEKKILSMEYTADSVAFKLNYNKENSEYAISETKGVESTWESSIASRVNDPNGLEKITAQKWGYSEWNKVQAEVNALKTGVLTTAAVAVSPAEVFNATIATKFGIEGFSPKEGYDYTYEVLIGDAPSIKIIATKHGETRNSGVLEPAPIGFVQPHTPAQSGSGSSTGTKLSTLTGNSFYLKADGTYTTNPKDAAGYTAENLPSPVSLPEAHIGEQVTIDGTAVNAAGGQVVWTPQLPAVIYHNAGGGYTTVESEDANYQAAKAAVRGEYTLTIGGQSITIQGKVDGTSADVTSVSANVSGGNAQAAATPSTWTAALSQAAVTAGFTIDGTATGTLASFHAAGTETQSSITFTQDEAPKAAVSAGAGTAGVWTSDPINGYVVQITGPPDGSNALSLAAGSKSLDPFIEVDAAGVVTEKSGQATGYTVAITAPAAAAAAPTTDISSINLTETTAPAPGAGATAAVAGTWTASFEGETITIHGKADGTSTTAELGDSLLITYSGGSQEVDAADATATITLPSGYTIKGSGSTTLTVPFGTAPTVQVDEVNAPAAAVDEVKGTPVRPTETSGTITISSKTYTASQGVSWTNPPQGPYFALKGDTTGKAFTADAKKGEGYTAEQIPTPLTKTQLTDEAKKHGNKITVDGVEYIV